MTPCEESAGRALVLVAASCETMVPGRPRARALAVRGGRIAAVGEEAEVLVAAGPGARRIDLGSGLVLPGFIESHGHLTALGRALSELDLRGAASPDELGRRVAEDAARRQEGAWIVGRGWDQNLMPGRHLPDRSCLRSVASPVVLLRIDGHAALLNGAALARAGIGPETPDPPGGAVLRDEAGVPTGVLIDRAFDLVRPFLPAADAGQRAAALRRAVDHCLGRGITTFVDAGAGATELGAMEALAAAGDLGVRVYAMVDGDDPALVDTRLAAGPLLDRGRGFLTVRAVKLFADGALGSRGAALEKDYGDDPGNRGLLVTEPERIRAVAGRALAAGFQVAVHAIGDRANRIVLDSLAAAIAAAPGSDHRFRIEHAQLVAAGDVPRFAALGIIASIQPIHCTSDMGWVESRLGAVRLQAAYRWRSLLAAGASLVAGSDAPVEPVDPLRGIHALVTRQDAAGRPPGGWRPEERLSIGEAVALYTRAAAYGIFAEKDAGTLEPGKRADLVVLGRDIFAARPEELLETEVVATLVDGAIVHYSGQRRFPWNENTPS